MHHPPCLLVRLLLAAGCLTAAHAGDALADRQQTVSGSTSDGSPRVHITVRGDSAAAGCTRDYLAPASPGFSQAVRYFPGANTVTVCSAAATETRQVQLAVDPPALRVRLDWAGNDHDYDLYVNAVNWTNKITAVGQLDRDAYAGSDSGPGVENITFPAAAAGVYSIYVNYYSSHGHDGQYDPTTVTVYLKEQAIFSDRFSITRPEAHGGSLAGDGKSVWNVATLIIHGDSPGGYRVVDANWSAAALGLRDIFVGPDGTPVVREDGQLGVFPRTSAQVASLAGPDGGGRVVVVAGASAQFTARGSVNAGSGNDQQRAILGSFQSSDAGVAAIDDLGVLTGLAGGTASISNGYGGGSIPVVVSDRPAFDLYRTGEHAGEAVDDCLKKVGDPRDIVLLANNDFDERLPDGRHDDDDDTAQPGTDPDLMRLSIRRAHLTGTLRLQVSDPAVVLYKSDGTRLAAGDLTSTFSDAGTGSGYLGGLANAAVDVWLEGRGAASDVTISLVLDGDSGELARDEAHIRVVKPVLRNRAGAERDAIAVYSKESALILAHVLDFSAQPASDVPAFSVDDDLTRPADDNYGTLRLEGLSGAEVKHLRLVSDSATIEADLGGSAGAVETARPLWIYDPEGTGPIPTADKATVKAQLGVDALERDGARFDLTTAHDHFVRPFGVAQVRFDSGAVAVARARAASAGPSGFVGSRALQTLSGATATVTLASGDSLPQYGATSWAITQQPDGARVTKSGESSATFSFTTDTLGLYRVAMTYTVGGRAHVSQVMVTVEQMDQLNVAEP